MKLNAIIRHGLGIFVWWSDDRMPPDVPHLIVQLNDIELNDNSTNTSSIIDTKDPIITLDGTSERWPSNIGVGTSGVQIVWSSIEPMLQSTRVERRPSSDVGGGVELIVSGNVTGLYFADVARMRMRIIVPVRLDGQAVTLNYTYLEWTAVRRNLEYLRRMVINN